MVQEKVYDFKAIVKNGLQMPLPELKFFITCQICKNFNKFAFFESPGDHLYFAVLLILSWASFASIFYIRRQISQHIDSCLRLFFATLHNVLRCKKNLQKINHRADKSLWILINDTVEWFELIFYVICWLFVFKDIEDSLFDIFFLLTVVLVIIDKITPFQFHIFEPIVPFRGGSSPINVYLFELVVQSIIQRIDVIYRRVRPDLSMQFLFFKDSNDLCHKRFDVLIVILLFNFLNGHSGLSKLVHERQIKWLAFISNLSRFWLLDENLDPIL